MAFGIYIHIPHCLQVCPYCDFTKYESGKILPPDQYVAVVRQEIRQRARDVRDHAKGELLLDTLYFGGGTPSLLEPDLILALIKELANEGIRLGPTTEFTIEINPGTVDREKLQRYLDLGINRFSVGAQTFNERLLKIAGRKHSIHETVETLSLLKSVGANISFDLLFALPSQSLKELELDLVQALAFDPSHLSAYVLTVPEQHPMAKGRAPEEEQVAMFNLIESRLKAAGLERYELSSYAKPGFSSRHNHLYWTDEEYWGLGVSAHSYLKSSPWGTRFWNPTALPAYLKQIDAGLSRTFPQSLPSGQIENLLVHQALTDFCHVRLRMMKGLDENALRLKFKEAIANNVIAKMRELRERGLLENHDNHWSLSEKGRLLSNVVFEHLTFLDRDISTH